MLSCSFTLSCFLSVIMASTQERKHIPEQTQTSDNSTESLSCAILG